MTGEAETAGVGAAAGSGAGFFGFRPRFFFSGGPLGVAEVEGGAAGAGAGMTGAANMTSTLTLNFHD